MEHGCLVKNQGCQGYSEIGKESFHTSSSRRFGGFIVDAALTFLTGVLFRKEAADHHDGHQAGLRG